MTEQLKSYDDPRPVDPWLRVIESDAPPCDCPCHHWRQVGPHAPCCANAGRRYVTHGGYYTDYED